MNIYDTPTEHTRRVTMATHAIHAAIDEDEVQAQDMLMEITMGDDDGVGEWARLATAAYIWVDMVTDAGRVLDIPDMHAELPQDMPLPTMPISVRGAAHIFNLGLSRQWREAGEVLGAAVSADHGYETITQLLWVCASLLRRLRIRPEFPS